MKTAATVTLQEHCEYKCKKQQKIDGLTIGLKTYESTSRFK